MNEDLLLYHVYCSLAAPPIVGRRRRAGLLVASRADILSADYLIRKSRFDPRLIWRRLLAAPVAKARWTTGGRGTPP